VKVKDLKIGMILRPMNDSQVFGETYAGEWLQVTNKYTRSGREFLKPSFAMYLGTKEDLADIDTKWSDKFVLFKNKILAVDPSAWRYIEEVK